MASGYEITRVWGIPIKLHISMIIVIPYFMSLGLPFLVALLAILVVYTSVALHELGHSRAAMHYGYGIREILLLPIGGVAMLEQLPRKPIEELNIAIAGPLVSLILAIGSLILSTLFGTIGLVALSSVLWISFFINMMLCFFNLIPSFPMDGGRIFRAAMTPKVGRTRATFLAARMGRIFAVMGGFYGLFKGDFMLVLIAIFIYYAAGAEYRSILMHEQMKQFGFGTAPDPVHTGDFTVGPAPYERRAKPLNPFRSWIQGLYRDYEA